MCGSVHRGVFSTLGEYHEYIGGVLNTLEGTMSALGRGYHEYIGGYHDVHVGDTMSTLRDVQYIRGYHEYIGGYHECIGVFNRN